MSRSHCVFYQYHYWPETQFSPSCYADRCELLNTAPKDVSQIVEKILIHKWKDHENGWYPEIIAESFPCGATIYSWEQLRQCPVYRLYDRFLQKNLARFPEEQDQYDKPF